MAEDKMEVEESASEIKKKRIQFLKSVLNIYRARAYSLDSACQTRVADVTIPEHARNLESLREQIRGLHNEVTLLKTFQDSVNIIHNSITYLNVSNLNDASLVRELQQLVSEITFFSKSIMKIYEDNINEIENVKRKQDYSMALMNYKNDIELLKEQQKLLRQTEHETKILQKIEVVINKINIIRNMKQILIGKFVGKSEEFSTLEQFRTPFRRNLTVDDFSETWDIGL